MIATMTIEDVTDGDISRAHVEQVPCALLKPGDVAVMDNLSSRKAAGAREMIEKVGAEVLYLPPDSPGLNPIEKAWSRATKYCFDPPRRGPKKPSTKPSQNCFRRSPRRTQKYGSNTASEVYSIMHDALALSYLTPDELSRAKERTRKWFVAHQTETQ